MTQRRETDPPALQNQVKPVTRKRKARVRSASTKSPAEVISAPVGSSSQCHLSDLGHEARFLSGQGSPQAISLGLGLLCPTHTARSGKLWLSWSEITAQGIQTANRPLGSQVTSTERNRRQAEVRAQCRVLSTVSGKKQKVWVRREGECLWKGERHPHHSCGSGYETRSILLWDFLETLAGKGKFSLHMGARPNVHSCSGSRLNNIFLHHSPPRMCVRVRVCLPCVGSSRGSTRSPLHTIRESRTHTVNMKSMLGLHLV